MTTTVSAPPTGGRAPAPAPAPHVPGVLLPAVATASAVLLGALALSPVFASGAWFGAVLLTVVAVVSAGGVATWLRAPVFLVPIIQAVVMFAALVSRFTVDTAPLGFVPTSDALDQLRLVLADGLDDIDQFSPPVPVSEGVTAVAALGIGCLAIVIFVLQVSLRMPVVAGIALIAIYVVPSLVLDEGAPWWSFAMVAIGFMVLLVSDERVGLASWGRMLRRSEGNAGSPLAGVSSAALRLGAIAVAAAVALPILVPALTDAVLGRHDTGFGNGVDSGAGGTSSTIGLDPFVSLRKQLLAQPQTIVFTYSTTAEKPDYLRTVVLTSYSGETWRPVQFDPENNSTKVDDGIPADPNLPDSIVSSAKTFSTRVQDAALSTGYVPVPANLTGLTITGGSWFLDSSTRTVFAENSGTSTKGLAWSATALDVQPTAEQMRNAAPSTSDTDSTDRLRRAQIPQTLRELALEQTRGAATDYDRAAALESYFRNNFTYSLKDLSDTSANAPTFLEQFLTSKTGYCQQFAATFALMAESLGIQSRVVVGYTAGTRQPDGTYIVRGSDAHAWPEVYFSGIGWQRFEPTPASGGANIRSETQPDPGTTSSSTVSSGAGGASPSIKKIKDERDPSGSSVDGTDASSGTSADTWRVRGLLAFLVVAALLALVPA
ncbi:MAG TPA: DUF3488 and transglutaminase-like domain-containing protein, partial [Candidatus Nanopelagicales bacterium]|nr:DUF3488 and transglutaminase-like domain-containing protein [Candidatus Nanopelagicales bacterium]